MDKENQFWIEGKVFRYADTPSQSVEIRSVLGPYSVRFGDESHLNSLNQLFRENPRNVLLIDERVYRLYQSKIQVDESRIFRAEATENFKTLNGITAVLEFLQTRGFSKSETLVVVGGGTVQDVGSFVAACFKRGISWTYFPTTLLSMCDSCIGAKSSINFHEAKNQLGLFYAPQEIIIHSDFLNTLPQADVASGIGEALKLFVIAGGNAFSNYPKQVQNGKFVSAKECQRLIATALYIKKSVIEEDEFDHAHRKALNYGHTVGHVLESLTHYQLSHGLSVVIGMLVANELSFQAAYLTKTDKELIEAYAMDLLGPKELNLLQSIPYEKILKLLKKDKKASGQVLNFILVEAPGKVLFKKLPLEEALEKNIAAVLKKISACCGHCAP